MPDPCRTVPVDHRMRRGDAATLPATLAAWLLAVLAFPGQVASASESSAFVPEYCGQSGEPAMESPFAWECSGIEASSLRALEESLAAEYERIYSQDGMSIHESKASEPFSAWIFWGDRAIRYRAVFHEEQWRGVAVTTFCTGTDSPEPCDSFGALAARNIPGRLFFKLGPPPPVEPRIHYD